MAVETTQFSETVKEFNGRYGVNFSYEDYERRINESLKGIDKNNTDAVKQAYDKAFIDTAKDLYAQKKTNALLAQKVDDNAFSIDMIDDLEYMLIEPYRVAGRKDGVPEHSTYRALSGNQRDDVIRDGVSSVPDSIVSYYSKQYSNGKMTLGSINEFADNLGFEHFKSRDILTMLRYSKALKEVNENRSIWWKIIHPILNYREKNTSARLEAKAETFITENQKINKMALLSTNLTESEYKRRIGPGVEDYRANLEKKNLFDNAMKELNGEFRKADTVTSDKTAKEPISVKLEGKESDISHKIKTSDVKTVDKNKQV